MVITGLVLGTYTVFPFDEMGGFETIAFMLQFFFNVAVYLPIAIKMFQTAKVVEDQKRAFRAIGFGAILMLVTMLCNTMGGILQASSSSFMTFNTAGVLFEGVALAMFFIGYIQPALSGSK